jgi:hypothetical protein
MNQMMTKIKNLFFQDLNQIERAGFPIALMIVLYGFFLALVNNPYFEAVYTVRNGFLCKLQQLFLFLMMLISFYRAYSIGLKQRRVWFVLMWVFFGFLFFFGWGEKVRWGQFVFDLPVPEFFVKYNTQGQITLHNLKFGDFSVNKIIFGSFLAIVVVIYTLVLPFLSPKYEKLNALIKLFGLPIPRPSQIAWYALIVAIALAIPMPKKGEVVQFAGVWSFLMFFCFPKNKEDF